MFFTSDYGTPEGQEKSEKRDMINMFLEICLIFDEGFKKYMIDMVDNVGMNMAEQKDDIIKVSNGFGNILQSVFVLKKWSKPIRFNHLQIIISRNIIKPKYAKMLVEFLIEALKAYESDGLLPNYDKLYEIVDEALYGGDHTRRIVFDWLPDEEKAAARKIPFVSIQKITFIKV